MQQILLILHVMFALGIIALVLMQHGKGADVGATFGGGASNTMFGSQGSMPFLMKITALLAALFFVTSLTLTYLVAHMERSQQSVYSVPDTGATQQSTPAKQAPSGVMDIPDAPPPNK